MTSVNEVVQMCSGGAGTGPALFEYWDTHDCPRAYQIKLNSNTGGYLIYTEAQAKIVQQDVNELFVTYQQTNQITNNPLDPGYNPFQEKILSLCLDPALPGVCSDYLGNNFCYNVTRNELTGNATLTNFCGCFVPPDPNTAIYGTTGCFGGSGTCKLCPTKDRFCSPLTACDTFCHRATTVHQSNLATGRLITCPQDVCAIDDITINAENSKVPGGINFTSICSGCQGSSCLCVITGVNLSETLASIGIGENFHQFCGADSLCYQSSADGSTTAVSCDVIKNANIPVNEKSGPDITVLIIVLIVLFILLFLLFFFYL